MNKSIDKVKIAVCDIDGILRGKYMDRDKFDSAKKDGFGFCNVIFGWDAADKTYDNGIVSGWHNGYPDGLATPDLDTKRSIPWENNTPFFLADFSHDGQLKEVCPRSLLHKIQNQALEMGLQPIAAKEYEWFNFYETRERLIKKGFTKPRPITRGMFGYSLLRLAHHSEYVNMLWEMLKEFNIPLEGLHTETGDGVYEAAIKYSHALEAADRAVLFKAAVKEIALGFDIMPSFMAKWNADLPGCSAHTHLSLKDDTGINLFYDGKTKKLSTIGESYLAGILHCLPHILPMYAPTINSYKRLVAGSWAATSVSYGYDNRTTAARIILSGEKSTRIELRVPGADANPYLSIAAAVASGLYGIKNNLTLDDKAISGNAYAHQELQSLANNLGDATHTMQQSEIAKILFGESFVDHFVRTRQWEVSQHEKAVSNWELERYFEII